MEKTEIINKFDANMERESIEIAKTWEQRKNSDFGQKLTQFSNLCENLFDEDMTALNIIIDAYLFDGEKKECVEKIRKELYKYESKISDEVISTFVDLESMADLDIENTGIEDFINNCGINVISEKSKEFNLEYLKDLCFMVEFPKKHLNLTGKKIQISYESTSDHFDTEFTTCTLNDEELDYIQYKLAPEFIVSKSQLCDNVNIKLCNDNLDITYDIATLLNGFVTDYKINEDNSITLHISSDYYERYDDSDDQITCYIQGEFNKVFNSYDPIKSFNEKMTISDYDEF